MGHVRDYSIGDAYARFRRARGDAVLFGFGFDAFGLPAEMAAIERKVPPAEWVESCGERMLEQMKRLGFSFDYDRVFYSSDEGQYRWSQWLFLTLLEAGLIYRDDATVDWCDTCQTTLAALQVEDGRCWRCHNEVRLIRRPTWFLRITPYLEENDAQPRAARETGTSSRSRPSATSSAAPTGSSSTSSDAERAQRSPSSPRTPTRSAQARFVLALAAPSRGRALGRRTRRSREQLDELRSGGWERSARDAAAVPVVDTGASVAAPGRRRAAGASSRRWSTPASGRPRRSGSPRSTRPTRRSPRAIAASAARRRRRGRRRGAGRGAARRSATAPPTSRSRASATGARRSRSSTARAAARCRCRSRTCRCVLPRDIEPTGEGNPLAERPDFVDVACPRCGEPAKRETDTLDCHFDALWLWVPAAVPPEDRAEQMFSHPDLRSWLPAERLVAGNDSGSFVFDQRVVTKALRDIGPFAFLEDGEPFAGCLFHEMVDRRRPQDEQAPRQRRRPRRAGRAATAPTRCGSPILYAAGPGEDAELERRRDALRRRASSTASGTTRWTASPAVEEAPVDEEAETDTALHPRAPGQMVRERRRPDHRRPRGPADAQGGAQRHPALRADPGLREARGQAPRAAQPRRRRGAGRGAGAALPRVLAPFAPHFAEGLLIAAGREDDVELLSSWPQPVESLS